MLKVLAERSGQDIDQLIKWGDEDRLFTAEESLRLGFIDKIVKVR